MRILLDSHILLWALVELARLPGKARSLVENDANEILFSAASIWEIAIKAQSGRIDFPVSPDEITATAKASGFNELRVSAKHGAAVRSLQLTPPRSVRPPSYCAGNLRTGAATDSGFGAWSVF